MSDQLIEKIYNITKKYKDPVSNVALDKDNKSFSVITKNGNISISLSIESQNIDKYESLLTNMKKSINEIKEALSVNIALTSEKNSKNEIGSEKRFSVNAKNIIAVASGKGGVGKSTFAVNYAVALKTIGFKVGILDADIYGPSVPRMMGISGRPQANENKKLIPLESYGIKCMSIGFLIGVDTPTIWRGPMVMKALEQMFNGVEWGELDYLIIDLPPGTGDAQLTLAQSSKLSGSIIISTPQDVALIDARKGINMFNRVQVPVLGIVENMSYFICSNCDERHEIFSNGGARKEAEKFQVSFLGELPIDKNLRIHSDEGRPICISEPESYLAKIYIDIAKKVHKDLI
jgi:ATP-binding protein involved in chromosome partitioning|tara:strand:+ start:86 stop:1126 length:1041 start_codon:yes stop_codon:yes gene_type:complete